jgi:cell division protein FtsZ
MALNLKLPGQENDELKPRITVFGVGGAGGNAVNNMIDKDLQGVEFVVANTDAQALAQSRAPHRIQMGVKVTEGLGAGARPEVGAAAAEEAIEEIVDKLAGSHMCFITAGMGGGTGTGAAPIIAQAARELGVLTVGVVTKPFQFEGARRMRQAEAGVEALQKVVDTLIIIPNQNLFRIANEKTTFTEAFAMADDVLYQGVKGVTDLMVKPGLMNLDFADIRSVMDEMGKAMMGTGEASGPDRAIHAAEKAIANPLLDEISLNGAKGVLINITGGYDLTLFELDEAANIIREKVDPDANIIVGSTFDPAMEGIMRVSVVATGIDASPAKSEAPAPRRRLAEPLTPPAAAEAAPDEPPLPLAPAARAPAGQPAAAEEPAAKPAAARAGADAPGLFADMEPEEFLARQEWLEAATPAEDLPPPAYAPAARGATSAAENFVAPGAPRPGTPSPEALRRLEAAIVKAPPRPAASAAAPPAASPAPAPDAKPRFGINALISRMTGAGSGAEPGAAARAQPPLQGGRGAAPPADLDPDHDRIEIPAFLRRQAN